MVLQQQKSTTWRVIHSHSNNQHNHLWNYTIYIAHPFIIMVLAGASKYIFTPTAFSPAVPCHVRFWHIRPTHTSVAAHQCKDPRLFYWTTPLHSVPYGTPPLPSRSAKHCHRRLLPQSDSPQRLLADSHPYLRYSQCPLNSTLPQPVSEGESVFRCHSSQWTRSMATGLV